jgi:hypothetical protein
MGDLAITSVNQYDLDDFPRLLGGLDLTAQQAGICEGVQRFLGLVKIYGKAWMNQDETVQDTAARLWTVIEHD